MPLQTIPTISNALLRGLIGEYDFDKNVDEANQNWTTLCAAIEENRKAAFEKYSRYNAVTWTDEMRTAYDIFLNFAVRNVSTLFILGYNNYKSLPVELATEVSCLFFMHKGVLGFDAVSSRLDDEEAPPVEKWRNLYLKLGTLVVLDLNINVEGKTIRATTKGLWMARMSPVDGVLFSTIIHSHPDRWNVLLPYFEGGHVNVTGVTCIAAYEGVYDNDKRIKYYLEPLAHAPARNLKEHPEDAYHFVRPHAYRHDGHLG